MEILKLNFDTELLGKPLTYTIEVPYQDGLVATSMFCPTEFLSGAVDIMAAVRGESLDKFMEDCRRQLIAMSKMTEAETNLDFHIGGLMAVVMDHFSRHDKMPFGKLLIHVDCFCLILKAAGYDPDEIRAIYPRVTQTIVDLYPDHVDYDAYSAPFTENHS
ncbi:MAG: hypothetical protein K2M27_03385 [Muribaculaceae bacterium]|nr:hypothetical protein [Muribaculaceae bacterium]